MNQVKSHIAISLDGYVAGPNQSQDNPIGEGGMRLHDWIFKTDAWQTQHAGAGGEHNVDSDVVREASEGIGAYVMGRNMFDHGRGDWDESWQGWWGPNPPFHVPVFVLTHYARDPIEMDGGTTFHFVTGGIGAAVEQARAAAGDGDVAIAGGAQAIQQTLAAGLLDELQLHIVPIVLGAGERLLVDVGDPQLEPVEVVASPAVTHVRYHVARYS
ncbi:MAG TPA: dihydrofolate reductase family protein [Solirubrobacteraceae bacterium]|nr:dihydrofolate reductase family protein [Solirubrobacteraceae bacterium]